MAVAPKETLLTAVKHVGKLAGGKNRIVRLSFQQGALLIEAHDSDSGEARERVDLLDVGTQDGCCSAFNWQYIVDYLRVCDGDEIRVGLSSDSLVPAVFRDGASPAGSEVYALMPCRL